MRISDGSSDVCSSDLEAAQGPEKAREKFRLQWTENAEHVTPLLLPTNPARATTTWLIDYMPSIEQGLADLATWVEKGIPPAETSYSFSDGKVKHGRASCRERVWKYV